MAEPGTAAPSTSLPRTAVVGVLAGVLFLCASIVWRFLVECLGGVALLGVLFASGADPTALTEEELQAMMRADLIAVISAVQLIGLLALAVIAAGAARFPFRRAFALGGAGVLVWIAAGLGGLTVGWFPGWIAEHLTKLAPWLSLGNLDVISEAIAESPLLGKVLMVLAVCVVAPIAEELIFRGFLWDAFERAMPPWAVWLLTSALFAVYHVDPVHVISVAFTGLFLGWLRHVSGSVWPSVLAHFCNNALGAVAVLTMGTGDDVSSPWWAAVLSLVLTLGFAGLGWLGRTRSE